MRVFVFGMSADKIGGISMFLLNMNKFMSDNCIFDYILPAKSCILENEIIQRGGKIFYISEYRKHPLKYLHELWNTLKNNKNDHKAAYFNLYSMVHMIPVLICKLAGYKVILHAHNNEIPQKSQVYRMLHNINRFLFGGMKCLRLTNSAESALFMFGKGKFSTTQIIYNAIDTDKFRFNSDIRQQIRNELNIENKFVVGFSGRITAEKNPLFLIKIFEQIHRRRSDSVLIIAGDGEMRNEVEEFVNKKGLQNSVIMLGIRKDIEKIYQAMDVLLLPSLFEGLGIALIEAQAAGLQCFTSENVVPKIAQISEDYLIYVSLDEKAEKWADTVLNQVKSSYDRLTWNDMVKNSAFNISNEALYLEKLLCS